MSQGQTSLWRPSDPEKIKAAYISGTSAVRIATEYGVTNETVTKFLRREGIQIRTLSQALKNKPRRAKWTYQPPQTESK